MNNALELLARTSALVQRLTILVVTLVPNELFPHR
jgi:hypothetical protein